MDLLSVMAQLESLGTEQTKKTYKNHSAQEPLFGVTVKAMKPLAKKIKKNHALAMALYATGNYDAAFLAGMITEPQKMSIEDFELWIKKANCHAISDYVVAVTLAETDFAMELADNWIDSRKEYHMSAGWNCYCWLLQVRPDNWFIKEKIDGMLQQVVRDIHSQPNWVKYAMNNFIIAVGVSYLPLHEEALKAALQIGIVDVNHGKTNCKTPLAEYYISKAVKKQKLGFKRKNVRC